MTEYRKFTFNFLNDFKSRNLSFILPKSGKLPIPGKSPNKFGKNYGAGFEAWLSRKTVDFKFLFSPKVGKTFFLSQKLGMFLFLSPN